MAPKPTIAYDTNTFRSEDLIPFIIKKQAKFHVKIPAIVYAERGYSFLLNGESFQTFDEEIATYNGDVLPLTREQVVVAINLAHKHRKNLPFRDHGRDYLIAGQCQGTIDIFISYNVKHFQVLSLSPTRTLTPEEFILEYAPF
jgi:predicted nucleic acid-binding protein